jgi:lauroyl/myristoyl acyltransferase
MRNRIEWLALALAMKIVPVLPRSVCYAIGRILGTLAYLFHGNGRRVALANLEAALGTELTEKERRMIAQQSYHTFATTLVDLLWSSRLTRQNFRRYIEVEGLENLEDETGRQRLDIGISIHYGNFEWISLAMGFLGFPGDIVAERSKNPLLEPLMSRARNVSGHTVIPREGAMVRLYRTVRQGGHVANLRDDGACVAPPANGASDHCRALRAAVPRSLSCQLSSQSRYSPRCHGDRNCSGVLGFVRAGDSSKSGSVAVDV